MKKDYRRVLIYGLVMLACVIVIVIMGILSQKKIDGYEDEYQNLVTANQNSIRTLEEKIAELEKENKALQKQVNDISSQESDITTQTQVLSDLKDIFEAFKAGKTEEAKNTFKKIEPMGFDDSTLAYYELLKYVLEQ